VILADSSAWIEYLRATESRVDRRLDELIGADADELVTTEVVVMEVLAGVSEESRVAQLRRVLDHFELVPVEGLSDFLEAAAIYRTCRRQGETVRTRFDCLIAAVAIRVDAAVLHKDRDFEAIARHTPLRLAG
jgi:predicted nucleic acid-binding protein